MGKVTQKVRNHLMDVIVSELSNCLTDHQIMDKHSIPNATFYRYKKMIKHRIVDTLARQTDEDLALATMLLERRFSAGYRNARTKADSSSSNGEAYHFDSLARQYAWDLYTLQREGVIAAVEHANHFAVAGGSNTTMTNNNKTRPSCVPVPYPAGVIYTDEDNDKERAELEILQKRYLELIELIRDLKYCKDPTFRAWNPSHIKEYDEKAAQTEKRLIDAIANYQKQDSPGSYGNVS
jgi:hypothetical protein